MKEFKGTPGPWHWGEEGLGDKNHIVFGKEYPAEMTSKANKDLIAAAPELLESLQELISGYEDREHLGMFDMLVHGDLIQKANAAINKALGE